MSDVDGEHLRAAMRRHPAGRLRAIPRDTHSCEPTPRPGSARAARVANLLPLVFLLLLAAGALAAVWLPGGWRWLASAGVLALLVAFAGSQLEQRRRRQ